MKSIRRHPCNAWRALVLGLTLLPLTAAAAVPSVGAASSGSPNAASLYGTHCTRCHTEQGEDTALDGRILRGPHPDCGLLGMMSDQTLFLIIKDGGAAAGLSSAMPAYGARLNYDQMADLVGYLRRLCAGKSAGPRNLHISTRSSRP